MGGRTDARGDRRDRASALVALLAALAPGGCGLGHELAVDVTADASSASDAASVFDGGPTSGAPERTLEGMRCYPGGTFLEPQRSRFHPRRGIDGELTVSRDERFVACRVNDPYRIYVADLDTEAVTFHDVGEQFRTLPELTPSGDALFVTLFEADDAGTLLLFDTRTWETLLEVPHVVDYGLVEGPDAATAGARLIVLRRDGAETVLETRDEHAAGGRFATVRELLRAEWSVFPEILSEDGGVALVDASTADAQGRCIRRVDLVTGAVEALDGRLVIGALFDAGFDGRRLFAMHEGRFALIDLASPDVPISPSVERVPDDVFDVTWAGGWYYVAHTTQGLVRWQPGASLEVVATGRAAIAWATETGRLVLSDHGADGIWRDVWTTALDGSDRRTALVAEQAHAAQPGPDGAFVVGHDDVLGLEGWLARADGSLRPLPHEYRSEFEGGAATMDGTLVYRDYDNCLVRTRVDGDEPGEHFACSDVDYSTVLPLRTRHELLVISERMSSGQRVSLIAPLP